MPDEVVNAAKAAFDRRSGGDVAHLVYDSLVDADQPAEAHVLRFEHGRLRIEMEVSVTDTGSSLRGTAVPPSTGQFVLMVEGSELGFVQRSDDGSFAFGPLGHGIVRLVWERDGASNIQTDWFRI